MKDVTRAAEEPRPVLWASWRRTLKSVKVLEVVGDGGGSAGEVVWAGWE